MTQRERLTAPRLLVQHDVEVLAPTLNRAYPIDEAGAFDAALKAIDDAECQVWKDCERAVEKLD